MAAVHEGNRVGQQCAQDQKTGEVVSELKLPGNPSGNPMTYMVNGKRSRES